MTHKKSEQITQDYVFHLRVVENDWKTPKLVNIGKHLTTRNDSPKLWESHFHALSSVENKQIIVKYC